MGWVRQLRSWWWERQHENACVSCSECGGRFLQKDAGTWGLIRYGGGSTRGDLCSIVCLEQFVARVETYTAGISPPRFWPRMKRAAG